MESSVASSDLFTDNKNEKVNKEDFPEGMY